MCADARFAGRTSLEAGDYHTCVVTTGGSVVCWGSNINVPASASGGQLAVAGGRSHTCTLSAAGGVTCWGGASDVPSAIAAGGQVAVSAGVENVGSPTCALSAAGGVTCWGSSSYGQTVIPVSVTASSQVAVSVGGYHTCALSAAGGVTCWGLNDYGQTNVPGGVATSGQVAVAAGGYHACSLSAAGGVSCWGHDHYGEATVPSVATSGQVAIAAGCRHTCALSVVGGVTCWGRDWEGQVAVPAAVAASGQVAIAAGCHHTCTLSAGGWVTCWGSNSGGQMVIPATFAAGGVALPCRPVGVGPSGTRTATGTATATSAPSASGTASGTHSGTPTPYCAASLFRPLPRTDLVGVLASSAFSPGVSTPEPSEAACRQACCLAPACDGYAFATSELRLSATASCFLYGGVTSTAPNSGYASGLRIGVELPGTPLSPAASASSAHTPLPGGGRPPVRNSSATPTRTVPASSSSAPSASMLGSPSTLASPPSTLYRGVTFSPTDFFPVMASPHAALWRLRSGLVMPAMSGQDLLPTDVVLASDQSGFQQWRYPFSGFIEAQLVVTQNSLTMLGGQLFFPARPSGTILMHPGGSNEHPQLQWVAPVSGRVAIDGLVYPVDQMPIHNAGINVFHNFLLIARIVCGTTAVPFNIAVTVGEGDVVTFGIDYGDNGAPTHDATGLDAAINYVFPTESHTPSQPPSPSATPSSTPYCAPSLFRPLPRTDLVGSLVGTALSPGVLSLQPSIEACREACCDAPVCDGFAFAASELAISSVGAAGCFLYVNITQLIPSSGYASGVYESAL